MEGYTQIPIEYIDNYKYRTLSESGFVFYDSDKTIVTNFEPHVTEIVKDHPYNGNTSVPGKPLYIKNDDYEKLLQYIEEKKATEATEATEAKEKKRKYNNKMIEEAQNYVTTIINESDLLSQNDKANFIKKINDNFDNFDNFDKIEHDSVFKKEDILRVIYEKLNTAMGTELLFTIYEPAIKNEITNADINLKYSKLNHETKEELYSIKINVPNILFFYDFKTDTLSLSKLYIQRDHTITILNGNLSINTSIPISNTKMGYPLYNSQNAISIYKIEGNPLLQGFVEANPPDGCLGKACKTFKNAFKRDATINPAGGKRTRKQKKTRKHKKAHRKNIHKKK